MQMCPKCDRVYDESEYSRCPYCSGELEVETEEVKIKDCPCCGGIMYWDDWDNDWECSNCDNTIDTDEDDYDAILER